MNRSCGLNPILAPLNWNTGWSSLPVTCPMGVPSALMPMNWLVRVLFTSEPQTDPSSVTTTSVLPTAIRSRPCGLNPILAPENCRTGASCRCGPEPMMSQPNALPSAVTTTSVLPRVIMNRSCGLKPILAPPNWNTG